MKDSKETDNEIKIVVAKPEDIRAIREVQYKSWLATYPNEEYGVTIDDVEDKFKDAFSEEKLRKGAEIIANSQEAKTILAVDDGVVVGFCRVVVSDTENKIGSIYILPEYQRKGIGSKLWQEVEKLFDPGRNIYVGVATYNVNAISFYEKLGFKATGKSLHNENLKMKSGAVIPEMEMVIEN